VRPGDVSENAVGELADEFAVLNSFLYTGGEHQVTMHRLVSLAVESVPGCDWAALTVWPVGRHPFSLAYSNDVAADVDRLQYDIGEGPCLTAAAESEVIRIPDLAVDERWPKFASAVLATTPVRETLAFPLDGLHQRHALNLYSRTAAAFDGDAVVIGALFAAHARTLLMHVESSSDVMNLRQALATSRQIGAAVGIVMSTHKITEDQAFDLLRTTSQNLNRKLRDIADDVTESGELPNDRR
jgi:hypothetical protein